MFSLVGIIVGLLVSIGVGAVLRALTRPPQAQPGKLDLPTAEEGSAIPAIFGTIKVAPNIVWWGDVEAEPIKGSRRVFGLVGPRDTLGHKYHVGMQGALCWGQVDALVEIIVDRHLLSQFGGTTTRTESGGTYTDTFTQVVSPSLPVTAVAAGQALTITANNLFGGKEKEGGVSGTVRFYFGSATQAANTYLVTKARNPFPAYKGLCYAVWEHTYLGTVPYLKHWHFVVRRCPTTLGVLAGDISLSLIQGVDANPAEVLWELYTDTRWGLARSGADLDQASFLAALSTLKAENCGISGQFTATTADDAAKEILRHIDGVLVQDPTTGLLRLKLIRADYTVADLLVFTESSYAELQHTRPQMPELVTEVKVNYTDRASRYTQRTRAAYNQALRQALGRAQSVTVAYPWFTTGTNAGRVALRDLHAHSSEFATGSMVANRSAAYLAIGDPFIINAPAEGLTSVVCRVTRIDYGTIHERETVTMQWAEDVFGSQGGVYIADPPDAWVEPPGTNAGQRFDVDTTETLSATQNCLTLTITGDVSAISLIETRTQKGNEAASAWTTQPNTAPITVCVDRADVHPGRIAYRISFTDGNGATQTLEDEVSVPPRGVYAAPRIDLTIDGAGAVTATVVPDGGAAAAVRCVGDTAGYPADATVDAATPDTVAPFTFSLGTLTAGQTLYVKAVATDSSGRKSPYATAYIARSGAGVTDGDKGDITVTASGATWTIDPDVVTFAKMQNVSTARLLGRDTAGSGDIEELTASEALALLGGTPGGGSGGNYPVGYLRSFDGIVDSINDNFEAANLDTTGTRFTGAQAWTWDNQGSASATLAKSKCRLLVPASTGGHRIIWVPAPSGNWKIRCRLGWPIALLNSTKGGGMILKDSVGGKVEFFGWAISPSGIIWSAKYTSTSVFSATRATVTHTIQFLSPRYLEIEKDGTNYYLRFGNDETGMIELTSFAHTNFLDNVADRIGLSVLSENAAGSSSAIDVEEFFRVT